MTEDKNFEAELEAAKKLVDESKIALESKDKELETKSNELAEATAELSKAKEKIAELDSAVVELKAEKHARLIDEVVSKEVAFGLTPKTAIESRTVELKSDEKYTDQVLIELSKYAEKAGSSNKAKVNLDKESVSSTDSVELSTPAPKYTVVVNGGEVSTKEY